MRLRKHCLCLPTYVSHQLPSLGVTYKQVHPHGVRRVCCHCQRQPNVGIPGGQSASPIPNPTAPESAGYLKHLKSK